MYLWLFYTFCSHADLVLQLKQLLSLSAFDVPCCFLQIAFISALNVLFVGFISQIGLALSSLANHTCSSLCFHAWLGLYDITEVVS